MKFAAFVAANYAASKLTTAPAALRFAPGRTGKVQRVAANGGRARFSPDITAPGKFTSNPLMPPARYGISIIWIADSLPCMICFTYASICQLLAEAFAPILLYGQFCCAVSCLVLRHMHGPCAGTMFAPGRTGRVRLNVDPIADFRPGDTATTEFPGGSSIAGGHVEACFINQSC